MRLSSIAVRNVRTHLWRSALVLVVIVASVAVVMSLYLVTRSAERDLEDKVDEYGANIVVVPRSEELPLTYGGVLVGGVTYEVEPLHMSDIDVIRGIENAENINLVAPKLVESVEVSGGPAGARAGSQALAVGVDWASELPMKQWWSIAGSAPDSEDDVLVGSRAATHFGLAPGDEISLSGRRFAVAGVLAETGTQEDELFFLDISLAQRLWDRPGEVSFFEVAAWCATCPIEDINAQISAEMPYARVSAVLKAAESREIVIGQFRLFTLVLSVLMVLVGCLIVLVSTLSSVRARRGEIGIFRSVGYRRQHIFQIILLENLGLALMGGVAGVLVALLVYGPVARAVAQVRSVLAPSPVELGVALTASLLVVLVASVYPAARAAALSPALAMKRV